MAVALDPKQVLRSTDGTENFQRLTRLLIGGGASLMREISLFSQYSLRLSLEYTFTSFIYLKEKKGSVGSCYQDDPSN